MSRRHFTSSAVRSHQNYPKSVKTKFARFAWKGLIAAALSQLGGSAKTAWLTRFISTDRLALTAAISFVAGGLLFGYAMTRWASLGFGTLTEPQIPRVVVLGLTTTVATSAASFVLSSAWMFPNRG